MSRSQSTLPKGLADVGDTPLPGAKRVLYTATAKSRAYQSTRMIPPKKIPRLVFPSHAWRPDPAFVPPVQVPGAPKSYATQSFCIRCGAKTNYDSNRAVQPGGYYGRALYAPDGVTFGPYPRQPGPVCDPYGFIRPDHEVP